MDNIGGAELVTLIIARELKADIYTTVVNHEAIKKLGFSTPIKTIGWIPTNPPLRQQCAAIRFKLLRLKKRYDFYRRIIESFQTQKALHEILDILNNAKKNGGLNNNNIPSMVENYFFEMNIIIHELSRVLAPCGKVYMVNDNVQYIGEEVPVDLILSDLAESAGMQVDSIWVLPKGKGNSSQQMGQFGRTEIRKCIYVWSKPHS